MDNIFYLGCSYAESKNKLRELLEAIENKKWEIARDIGRLAYSYLKEANKK